MSIQSQLAQKITERFNDVTVKKVDKDNFLDIHIPSVNEKKGTHLFFNTSKGKIKMGFYCRDNDFVSDVVKRKPNRIEDFKVNIEEYSQGLRPYNNPEFESVDEAILCAVNFISRIGGIVDKQISDAPIEMKSKNREKVAEQSQDPPEIKAKSTINTSLNKSVRKEGKHAPRQNSSHSKEKSIRSMPHGKTEHAEKASMPEKNPSKIKSKLPRLFVNKINTYLERVMAWIINLDK